jgi:hypothetical protein
LVSGWASPAAACKCAERDIRQSYASADAVLEVRVLWPLPAPSGQRRYLAVTTADAYKGCIERHAFVVVQTNRDSAACGIRLPLRSHQLLFATSLGERFGLPLLSTGSCSGNRAPDELTQAEQSFLSTRSNCCGDVCSCVDDAAAVECLVDPCSVSHCSEPGAVCVSNTCGGCHAEWFTPDGDPALRCDAPQPTACDDPHRKYVARDGDTCARTDFLCEPGSTQFTDACGCGCITPDRPEAVAPCRHAGCSGELCIGPNDDPPLTSCLVRPEYGCLRLTTCEPQAAGGCGFTQAPQYLACLELAHNQAQPPH